MASHMCSGPEILGFVQFKRDGCHQINFSKLGNTHQLLNFDFKEEISSRFRVIIAKIIRQ